MTNKVLVDKNGTLIEVGDRVVVPYYNHDKERIELQEGVVQEVCMIDNVIVLEDDEPIELDKYEVLVIHNENK